MLYHKFADGDTPNEIVERAGVVKDLSSSLPCKSPDFETARQSLTSILTLSEISPIWVETMKPNNVRYRERHPVSGNLNLPTYSTEVRQAFDDKPQADSLSRVAFLLK